MATEMYRCHIQNFDTKQDAESGQVFSRIKSMFILNPKLCTYFNTERLVNCIFMLIQMSSVFGMAITNKVVDINVTKYTAFNYLSRFVIISIGEDVRWVDI